MNKLLFIAALAALSGCASMPDERYGYGQPAGPDGWRVVSVTPVPVGTGERVARETGSPVQYSSAPLPAPIYQPAPVYAPQPVYSEPASIYPPLLFGLGLVIGKSWGGHRHHHHYRGYRRHR